MSVSVVKLVAATSVWITFALIAMSGFTMWYVLDQIKNPTEQAFAIDRFEVLTPVVEPGEDVVFRLEGRRFRECPSIIAAFWINKATGAAVTRFPLAPGGYSPLDPDGYALQVKVKAPDRDTLTGHPAEPGIYVYRSYNAPLCNNLRLTRTPDVGICLVVPGKPSPPCATDPAFRPDEVSLADHP